MINLTGKERLERLYKRLKKNYPDKDIRFEDDSLYFGNGVHGLSQFKVLYYDNDCHICNAMWAVGWYGCRDNMLEFYNGSEPIGHITELKAYNLFKKEIEANIKERKK